jgi:hypothetical protein
MSQVVRTTVVHRVVFSVALAGLGICGVATAQAGDLAPPMYGPAPYPPPPPPNYGAVYGHGGPCHVVIDRRVDPYGREIAHRVRVCDEGPMYPSVVGPMPSQEYGYPEPRYYEPQPSGYDVYAPRPPAPVGPGYYN